MPYDINSTITMLAALKQTFPPSTFLLDSFFPNALPAFTTEEVDMEYKKGTRKMAPFAVPGAKGMNSSRTRSIVNRYRPPIIKPRRAISSADITRRGFGETIYSEMTPEERAIKLRAEDLAELQEEIIRRLEWMAAQTLVYGEFEAKGYADDGNLQVVDTVTFDGWEQKLTLSGSDTWDNPNADIYGVLDGASQQVAKATGSLPGVLIVGKDGPGCILENNSLYKKMLVPNVENMKIMEFKPRYITPEVRYCGRIMSMNLDIYQYFGSYDDETGNHPFIPDNIAVLGVPGRGRQLYGAVTIVQERQHRTYAARFVPKVTSDEDGDTTTLSLYSRPVVVPEYIDDWYTIKFK